MVVLSSSGSHSALEKHESHALQLSAVSNWSEDAWLVVAQDLPTKGGSFTVDGLEADTKYRFRLAVAAKTCCAKAVRVANSATSAPTPFVRTLTTLAKPYTQNKKP